MPWKIVRCELLVQYSACKHARHVRTRADQGHVAREHIQQLRKLIQACLPQDPSERRDTRIVGRRLLRSFAVTEMDEHRPKLENHETAIVVAIAFLAEEHRA